MIEIGDKFEFIIAAYLVVILGVGFLSLLIVKNYGHQKKRVAALKQAGHMRKSDDNVPPMQDA